MVCDSAQKDDYGQKWTCSLTYRTCPYIYPNKEVCLRDQETKIFDTEEDQD